MFRRLLRREEIYQQADALHALEVWERVRDFALRIYGPLAHTVEVEQILVEQNPTKVRFSLVSEIDSWSVYDKEGNLLEPDLTGEFWQSYQELQQVDSRGTATWTKLYRIVRVEINKVAPPEEETYRLDHPPAIPFPAVYIDNALQTDYAE